MMVIGSSVARIINLLTNLKLQKASKLLASDHMVIANARLEKKIMFNMMAIMPQVAIGYHINGETDKPMKWLNT